MKGRCRAGAPAVSVVRGVDTIVEALRATREVATVTEGLKKLSKALRGEHAGETLSAFLTRSPHCEELHRLWDAPIMVGVWSGLPSQRKTHEGHLQLLYLVTILWCRRCLQAVCLAADCKLQDEPVRQVAS